MKKVLIVTDTSRAIETSIRARQYEEEFSKQPALKAKFMSRRPDWYLDLLANLGRHWWGLPLRRMLQYFDAWILRWREKKIVRQSRDCQVVYLLRIPSWPLHKALWQKNAAKVVMDLNDGLWLRHYRGRLGFDKLEDMLRCSHAVVCENQTLVDFAKIHNANASMVPDPPQIEEFDKFRNANQAKTAQLVLGWIGTPGSADNLGVIFEPLEDLFTRHHGLHLRILGADAGDVPRFENVRFSCKPVYSNREMIEEVLQMDIGLFPLYRTQDLKTRGSLKARIYMAGGVVAACQNWGDSTQLIRHRQNGVLAGTPDEWVAELAWLIDHPAERRAIAARGLETIRSNFTRAACFAKLAAVLENV